MQDKLLSNLLSIKKDILKRGLTWTKQKPKVTTFKRQSIAVANPLYIDLIHQCTVSLWSYVLLRVLETVIRSFFSVNHCQQNVKVLKSGHYSSSGTNFHWLQTPVMDAQIIAQNIMPHTNLWYSVVAESLIVCAREYNYHLDSLLSLVTVYRRQKPLNPLSRHRIYRTRL